MFRSKLYTDVSLSGSFLGRYEAYGLPSVVVRGGSAMSEGVQSLNASARCDASSYEVAQVHQQGGHYQAAYEQIVRRFGELGVPEDYIVPEVVDPLAAIVAAQRWSLWRLLDRVVDTSGLTDHPSTRVMTAVAAMTSDGARPVIPTAPFIDGVARAYADEFGMGGSWFNDYPSRLTFARA